MKPAATVEEVVEMLDGRLFWTDDNWVTIWEKRSGSKRWCKVPEGPASDLVRFLAVSQSSWAGDAS